MTQILDCRYSSTCSGCEWILKPADEQRALKIRDLQNAWKSVGLSDLSETEIAWHAIAHGGLRDRVDFMIDSRSGARHIGLFERERTGLLDLETCPLLSPPLEAWFQDFRSLAPSVDRGSVRLRVSPHGQRGLWLDFANVDVKRLLDERTELDRLRAAGVMIEIGQRRKRLVERADETGVARLKLDDAEAFNWFETYDVSGSPMALYCSIASFTQPGFAANRVLLQTVLAQFKNLSLGASPHIAEFGAGIGNFTLPFARLGARVDAYEIDELALAGLKRSLAEYAQQDQVEIFSGDFQGRKRQPKLEGRDAVFADPPRSGLKGFLDPLEALMPQDRPRAFVYVSCFAESFAIDAKRLNELGYRLNEIAIVDQFPQSRHYEIVSTFTRI